MAKFEEICYRCGREAHRLSEPRRVEPLRGGLSSRTHRRTTPFTAGSSAPSRTVEKQKRERGLERESAGPEVFPESWEEDR